MNNTYEFLSSQNAEQTPYTGGITVISDLHGQVGGLEETLRHAAQNDNAVAILGDIIGDGMQEYASQFGYQFPSQIQDEFLQTHMQPEEYQIYKTAQLLEQFGSKENAVEYFTSINGNEHRGQIEEEIDQLSEIVSSEEFKRYRSDLNEEFYKQKSQEVAQNIVGLRSLEQALKQVQFQQFSDVYSKVADETGKTPQIYWLNGNYEDKQDSQQFQNYLPDEAQVINIEDVRGYLTHKSSTSKENASEDITVAGTPNIFQGIQSYKLELYSSEELQNQMPHMTDPTIHNDLVYQGDISRENIQSLEQRILNEDKEAQRITNNGEENRDLDVFLTHGPIRTPIIDEQKKGREDPFALMAAYFSDNATVTAHGHIHNPMAGEDTAGNFFVRPAGQIYDMYKINGEMKVVEVPTQFKYDPEEPPQVDFNELKRYHDYYYQLELQKLQQKQKSAA